MSKLYGPEDWEKHRQSIRQRNINTGKIRPEEPEDDYPTKDCLTAAEVSSYFNTGELEAERKKHLDNCEFCQTLTWRPNQD